MHLCVRMRVSVCVCVCVLLTAEGIWGLLEDRKHPFYFSSILK